MITQGNEMAVLAHIDNGNGAADTMLEHQGGGFKLVGLNG